MSNVDIDNITFLAFIFIGVPLIGFLLRKRIIPLPPVGGKGDYTPPPTPEPGKPQPPPQWTGGENSWNDPGE